MIEIKKQKQPKLLTEYKQLPDASYENMHGAFIRDRDVYHAVLDALLNEQGHLCAYCMRRIPEEKQYPHVTIEHLIPQSLDRSNNNTLDYRNMVAVCNGNRGASDHTVKICDAHRGNKELKVNPLKPETLEGIKYSHSGEISSPDEQVNRDLQITLNLNSKIALLPQNRKGALEGLIAIIKNEHPAGDITNYCRKLLKHYTEQKEFKEPYVGILVYWLKRKSMTEA